MRKSTFIVAAATLLIMGCSKKADSSATDPSYIGPSGYVETKGRMTPEMMLSLGRLSDPQLSPDGEWILYGVSYTSIDENRSCRNLFMTPAKGGEKVQLTKSGKSISCARFSPDGKTVYYIMDSQMYSSPLSGLDSGKPSLGKAEKISDVKEGIGEFKLSSDGKKVLYISYVPSHVKSPKDVDPKLDKAQAYITEDLMYRHWDHFVTSIPHTFVASLEDGHLGEGKDILGGPEVKFELPIEPFGGLEQLSWSPDGRFVAYSCKKLTGKQYAFSTDTEIYIYDTQSGKTSLAQMGGGYDTDPVWSPDGNSLCWVSMKRNGYEADRTRLMLASVKDGVASGIVEITEGFDRNASSPMWSEDSKGIYFNALTDGLQAIFRADVEAARKKALLSEVKDDSSPIERLTSDELWYDFNTPFAVLEDGSMLTSYCSLQFPNELVKVASDGKTLSRITTENDAILSQVKEPRVEKRMVATVDGKQMLTWVLFPPQFDSTKTYPAIEILLGGPQGTISQGWSYRWNYRLMASQDYVVVLPNRRGTTAFGQEWCEQISGDYIGLNMQDYLSAARMIKSEPYIGKLAACGASYGGYSVYYMAGVHGDTFDCFIAHAGIFDEKYMWYETEEMWFPNWDNGGLTEYAYAPGKTGPDGDGVTFGGMQMAGSPWSSAPKARRHYSNSPADNVTKWHTPILCIHGMMDFRIPYDQGMAAFNCAQMMGVPSKLVLFPQETHWVLRPQNALLWHREYFDWLDRWCKPSKEGEKAQ